MQCTHTVTEEGYVSARVFNMNSVQYSSDLAIAHQSATSVKSQDRL